MMVVFNDTTFTEFVAKSRAELYMQLYKYAAEDFVATSDFKPYADKLKFWQDDVEQKITTLGEELKVHTHEITPHVHAMPHHTHELAPHFHSNGNNGSPTGPQMGPSMTSTTTLKSTESTLISTTQSEPAYNSAKLVWPKTVTVENPGNNTGAVSNLAQNRITTSLSTQGDLMTPFSRRQMTIPILLQPVLTPVQSALIESGVS